MRLRFWFGCGLVALMMTATPDYWVSSASAQESEEGARPGRGGGPGGGRRGGGERGGPGGDRGGRGGPGGQRGGFGGQRGGGDMTLRLLKAEPVQEELDMDEEQIAAVDKLEQRLRDQPRDESSGFNPRDFDFRNASEEERKEFFEKIQAAQKERASELRMQLEEFLFEEQLVRLDQISLQVAGVTALAQPEVQEKLVITEEQKTEFQDVRSEQEEKMRESMRGLRDARDRESIMEKIGELRKGVEDAVLAVLTTKQQTKFDEMKGKPFDVDSLRQSMFQGGRGGGGGRGGFGGGGRGGQGGGGGRGGFGGGGRGGDGGGRGGPGGGGGRGGQGGGRPE